MQASVSELRPLLADNRIEKIYQPRPYELYFKVKGAMVLISTHPTLFRIQNTQTKPQNPATPPMFCMLLRKHLTGGRIQSIDMQGKERIVTLQIENVDELYEKTVFTLHCELMGKHSNVILTDAKNTILDSIKRVPLSVSSVRQVLPGESYHLPPVRNSQDPLFGIGRYLREQINAGTVTLGDVQQAVKDPQPVIVEKKQGLILPIPGKEQVAYDTVGEMLDAYYESQKDGVNNTQLIKNLKILITRAKNKIKIHEKTLSDDETKCQLYGELLSSYAHEIKKGMKSVVLTNYYTDEEVTIPLDDTLSAHENAQRYYKKYNKKKTAKEYAVTQIEQAQNEIEYLENAVLFLSSAETEAATEEIRNELYLQGFLKRRKSKGKSKPQGPITYHTDTGAVIWVGRNSQQNDQLTLKKANSNDLWFHVKDIPGSHVILSGGTDDEKSILQAAQIAAYYSKSKQSSNVPVDYTKVKYVKKPAHALPGKVIYTEQKTLYVTPDAGEIKAFTKELN